MEGNYGGGDRYDRVIQGIRSIHETMRNSQVPVNLRLIVLDETTRMFDEITGEGGQAGDPDEYIVTLQRLADMMEHPVEESSESERESDEDPPEPPPVDYDVRREESSRRGRPRGSRARGGSVADRRIDDSSDNSRSDATSRRGRPVGRPRGGRLSSRPVDTGSSDAEANRQLDGNPSVPRGRPVGRPRGSRARGIVNPDGRPELEPDNSRGDSVDQQRDPSPPRRGRPRGVLGLRNLGFSYNPERNYNHPVLNIGQLSQVCSFCSARKFPDEPKGLCCNSGKVRLDSIEQPPTNILNLFNGRDQESTHFLQNIRRVNSCFQMTSFGVDGVVEDEWSHFKIQGQVYHRIGSLLPPRDEQPKFLQIYFTGDTNDQIDLRLNIFPGHLERSLILQFQQFFEQNNHLVRSFKTALTRAILDDARIAICGDRVPAGEHPGRYNAPTTDEVAVVIVEGDASRRDIVIQKRGEGIQRIYETHVKYDALQYPIIFWRGGDSFRLNMKQTDPMTGRPLSSTLTAQDYYSFHLMIRDDHQNYLLRCRQLLSQFVVDMYAKIESARLRWHAENQSALRAESYLQLRDAVNDDINVENIGRHVILPPSFIGGPRHMHQYAQDAMCYVRNHGRPDLFITFTCNSQWPEIVSNLMPGQPVTGRHDLVARVFKQKLNRLEKLIKDHELFGPTNCAMYTVEWQKRGLPHAHMLVWLKTRIRPDQIDNIISAELPDPAVDPLLFQIIVKNMIHGPCGAMIDRRSPCEDERKRCTKQYPRPLRSQTLTGNDGYPLYRRRGPEEGGQVYNMTVGQNSYMIDNSWVVPHSPVLSRMFNAHINVEYCNSVKSIKYICKYINKGSDMAVLNIAPERRNDEIHVYRTGRYIGVNEAFWKIFSFEIHKRYPYVELLPVHLEDEQQVYFNALNAEQRARAPPRTKLTEFFKLCSEDPFAGTLLYSEVPSYYTWNSRSLKWCRRQRGAVYDGVVSTDALGRIYNVHPSSGDRFYLRLLLTKVKGPISFQDLRTVNGELCNSYREACRRRGLLEDDNQWELCMREASLLKMPAQIRELFVVIITSCSPSDPVRLWELYREAMSEDILHSERRRHPDQEIDYNERIFNEALIIIEDRCVEVAGKSLADCHLPSPNRVQYDPRNSECRRELAYDPQDCRNYLNAHVPLLIPDQRAAYDTIIGAIDQGNGGFFFLDAPGGTGKTYLLNLLLAKVRGDQQIILACASSGIAATLFSGGRTAHSTFKIPVSGDRETLITCGVSKNSAKGVLLKKTKAIILDECTMIKRNALEAIDRLLKDIRNDNRIFGGVVMILSGDFRQCLPVVQRGLPADEIAVCLKKSPLWSSVNKLHLNTNMRVRLRNEPGAEIFAHELLKIGNGLSPIIRIPFVIKLPSFLCNFVTTQAELIDRVFPDLCSNISNVQWLAERAILATRNSTVDSINSIVQDRLEHLRPRIYYSNDQVVEQDDVVQYPIEFLNSIDPPGFPRHELKLRVGTPIIVLRNLNPPMVCNGTRLRVKNMNNNLIQATIMLGQYAGRDVLINRIPMITIETSIIRFKRTQFPIKLAFSVTINKSQGQTFSVVGVNLEEECFSHGQLYVSLSRVGRPSNLFVLAPNSETKNIVYPEALE